jgi:putative ABC transport system permease protein
MNIFAAAFEQSLVILPLIFGMYISYRILKITDLTVDGTYVLGAAVFARTLSLGLFPALSLSIIAGATIGMIVSYMQRNDRIDGLISGILATFMLYSVNLQILGRPNVSILGMTNILSLLGASSWLVPLIIINFIISIGLIFLLNNRLGLLLRAFGFNRNLLNVLGKPAQTYRTIGLGMSNALAAFTGALSAQVNGFADINMGFGVALISIGAIVIGLHIINNNYFSAGQDIIACFIGIFFYFTSLGYLLQIGIDPVNLKLVLGVILFISLSKAQIKR